MKTTTTQARKGKATSNIVNYRSRKRDTRGINGKEEEQRTQSTTQNDNRGKIEIKSE